MAVRAKAIWVGAVHAHQDMNYLYVYFGVTVGTTAISSFESSTPSQKRLLRSIEA